MHTRLKQSIIEHARSVPHEEVCGLVYYTISQVLPYPCSNVAADRVHAFEIDSQDYIGAAQLGAICGVYHSHPHGPAAFSEEDLETARELGVPFYLYCTDTGDWLDYTPPSYVIDPLHNPFIWGLFDCLTVVRTYYRNELNIHLTDFVRDESFERADATAITQYIDREGFTYVSIDAIQKGDVMLFKTPGSPFAHHLGVFIGNSRYIHHPRNALSRTDPLTGEELRSLVGVLRHKSLLS